MSDLTQIKTISGEYSGFNDTVARESITELSGAIDYVSGAVTGAGGDAEVNNYVYTNSAAINGTVSTYQTNSASYITELPDEEEVEFEEINLSSFATSSQINELSGAIDYVSANAGGGTDWRCV